MTRSRILAALLALAMLAVGVAQHRSIARLESEQSRTQRHLGMGGPVVGPGLPQLPDLVAFARGPGALPADPSLTFARAPAGSPSLTVACNQ